MPLLIVDDNKKFQINPLTAENVYTCHGLGGPKLRMTCIHFMKESPIWRP